MLQFLFNFLVNAFCGSNKTILLAVGTCWGFNGKRFWCAAHNKLGSPPPHFLDTINLPNILAMWQEIENSKSISLGKDTQLVGPPQQYRSVIAWDTIRGSSNCSACHPIPSPISLNLALERQMLIAEFALERGDIDQFYVDTVSLRGAEIFTNTRT